jgi:hypothetical protein
MLGPNYITGERVCCKPSTRANSSHIPGTEEPLPEAVSFKPRGS